MPLPIEDYIGAGKDNQWIRDFLADWKLDRQTGGGDASLFYKICRYAEDSPDSALALLVSLAEQSTDEEERRDIGEGLEWLLQTHGSEYWDTLNILCQRIPEFRSIMSSVWGASLPKELKRKVEMWRT